MVEAWRLQLYLFDCCQYVCFVLYSLCVIKIENICIFFYLGDMVPSVIIYSMTLVIYGVLSFVLCEFIICLFVQIDYFVIDQNNDQMRDIQIVQTRIRLTN